MAKKHRPIKRFFKQYWRVLAIALLGALISGLLLAFKLGNLVHGLSGAELELQQQVQNNAISLSDLARNPLFLPYYLGLYLIQLTPFHGPTAIRSVGALFGLLGALGVFYILRSWYSSRIAFFGAGLFATSTWFLHSARYAAPEVSYLLLPLLIAGMIALQAKARSKTAMLAVVLFGLLALYIPGVIWIILPALIIKRKVLFRAIKLQPNWYVALSGVIGLILLAPLVIMLIKPLDVSSLDNLLGLLGLPAAFPNPLEFIKQIGSTIGQILFISNEGPLYTSGKLPWFDIGTLALTIVGMYQFARHYKLHRSKLIAIVSGIMLILVALGGPVSIIVLLPFMYLFVTEGLRSLLDTWLGVFPRNPFARGFAVAVIVVVVGCISFYHLNRYFIAWANTPETRQEFNKLP